MDVLVSTANTTYRPSILSPLGLINLILMLAPSASGGTSEIIIADVPNLIAEIHRNNDGEGFQLIDDGSKKKEYVEDRISGTSGSEDQGRLDPSDTVATN